MKQHKSFKKSHKINISSMTILIFLLALSGCGNKDNQSNPPPTPSMANTKVVVQNGVRVVVDLMDKIQHDKMAAMMQMPQGHMANDQHMHHDMTGNHFFMITLIDAKTKKQIQNATVSLKLSGPDKKNIEQKTHIMQGKGMFHYAAGFDKLKSGTWNVQVDYAIADKKDSINASFQIK